MLSNCGNCKGVLAGHRNSKLVSEKNGVSVYEVKCTYCGSIFEFIVKEIKGPDLNKENLEKMQNIPL
jgi:hypothetical protein